MMNSIAANTYAAPVAKTKGRLTAIHGKLQAWTATLLVSATLGAVAGVGGLVIAGISRLEPNVIRSHAGTMGVVLSMAFLPLLFFTAHCMDKFAHARKQIRLIEYETARAMEGLRRDDDRFCTGEF